MILVEFFLAFRGIDWSSKDSMMESEWLIGPIRDFEQTATVTSTTGAAEEVKEPKNDALRMLGNDLSQAVGPNPTTYEDLSFDVSKQFNFSPLFYNHWF